jgi:hypothetical protein
MARAVLVDVDFEAIGQARPFAVIGIVASSTGSPGSAAAAGAGTFPRAGDMGLANPARAVAASAFQSKTIISSPES